MRCYVASASLLGPFELAIACDENNGTDSKGNSTPQQNGSSRNKHTSDIRIM